MIRRLLRLAARVLALVVVVAAALAGVALWRVRQGPVPIDFLVPRLRAAFAEDLEGWQVDLAALELMWDAQEGRVELHARGLRVRRVSDETELALDAVHVRLRRSALLRGRVVIRAIEVFGPKLQLVRDTAGRLVIQGRTEAGAPRDLGWLWSMTKRLEHVGVRDGEITLVDESSRTTRVVPRVDGDAWRSGGPLRFQLGLALATAAAPIPVWLEGVYRFEAGTVELRVTSPGAETAAAFAAWPAELAPQAHAWVTRQITGGRVRDAAFELTGHVLGAEGLALAVDTLEAHVAFEGLTVRYLDTMPPATAVAGRARFGREDLVATVDAGKVEGIDVAPATVRVAWPANAANHVAVDARVEGPLATLLSVLDNEPVALGQHVSLQSRGIAGRVAGRLRLAFPLEGRPKLGKLGLRATATVADASIPYGVGDWDVGAAAATITIDDRALEAIGTAELRGVPVAFHFRHHFGRPTSRRLELTSRVDERAWRMLDVDPNPWLSGPVDATVRIAPEPDGRIVADVEADLAPATLDVPPLVIKKAPGEPGRFVARLALARGVVTRVEHFQLTASATTVRGNVGRPASGGPWSRIDATASFALPAASDVTDVTGVTDVSGVAVVPVIPDVTDDDGAAMTLAMGALGDGWQTTVTSGDVGKLLRAYAYDRARGGRLTLEGTATLASGVPFKGALSIDHVTFSGVPWLVKLVSLASLKGLMDVGSQQTVAIDRMVAAITHRSPVIEIGDATARGPKLTVKLAGTIDHGTDAIDLQGTLIPSYYLLNEGAGSIPVIGDVLSMATGGAVQAVNFTVRGSRDEPVVAVQPLSSLAPGVLRDWLRKLGL